MRWTRAQLAWVALGGAVVALVLAAVAARSGLSHPIAQLSPGSDGSYSVPPAPTQAPASSPAPHHNGHSPGWLTTVLLAVLSLAIAVLILRLLQHLRRDVGSGGRRRPGRRVAPPSGTTVAVLDEAVEESLADVERGPVSDAVIACWVRVETAARDAGIGLRAADTSQEFAERVRDATPTVVNALDRLASLYREARFSSHTMDEGVRDEARACLTAIRDDLRAERTSGGSDAT